MPRQLPTWCRSPSHNHRAYDFNASVLRRQEFQWRFPNEINVDIPGRIDFFCNRRELYNGISHWRISRILRFRTQFPRSGGAAPFLWCPMAECPAKTKDSRKIVVPTSSSSLCFRAGNDVGGVPTYHYQCLRRRRRRHNDF